MVPILEITFIVLLSILSSEKIHKTYCQEIHLVPPEFLELSIWISYIEKYLLNMLIQVNPEEGHPRDGVELVNHFQQEKKNSICRDFDHKKLHAQIEMPHKEC